MCVCSARAWLWASRLLCPWNFPSKNTGMSCHFLPQVVFLTQGSNPSLASPALAGLFFNTVPPGKPPASPKLPIDPSLTLACFQPKSVFDVCESVCFMDSLTSSKLRLVFSSFHSLPDSVSIFLSFEEIKFIRLCWVQLCFIVTGLLFFRCPLQRDSNSCCELRRSSTSQMHCLPAVCLSPIL